MRILSGHRLLVRFAAFCLFALQSDYLEQFVTIKDIQNVRGNGKPSTMVLSKLAYLSVNSVIVSVSSVVLHSHMLTCQAAALQRSPR